MTLIMFLFLQNWPLSPACVLHDPGTNLAPLITPVLLRISIPALLQKHLRRIKHSGHHKLQLILSPRHSYTAH